MLKVTPSNRDNNDEMVLNPEDKKKLFIPEVTCVGNNRPDGTVKEMQEMDKDTNEISTALNFSTSLSDIKENSYTLPNKNNNGDSLNKNLIWAVFSGMLKKNK